MKLPQFGGSRFPAADIIIPDELPTGVHAVETVMPEISDKEAHAKWQVQHDEANRVKDEELKAIVERRQIAADEKAAERAKRRQAIVDLKLGEMDVVGYDVDSRTVRVLTGPQGGVSVLVRSEGGRLDLHPMGAQELLVVPAFTNAMKDGVSTRELEEAAATGEPSPRKRAVAWVHQHGWRYLALWQAFGGLGWVAGGTVGAVVGQGVGLGLAWWVRP